MFLSFLVSLMSVLTLKLNFISLFVKTFKEKLRKKSPKKLSHIMVMHIVLFTFKIGRKSHIEPREGTPSFQWSAEALVSLPFLFRSQCLNLLCICNLCTA